MRRHSGSKQKPVPKSASSLRVILGLSPAKSTEDGNDFFGFNFSFSLNSVIGRTVLLRSCANTTEVSGTNLNRSGKAVWLGAARRKNEQTIKIERTLRKIIRCRPTLNQSVNQDGTDSLFVLGNGADTNLVERRTGPQLDFVEPLLAFRLTQGC